MWHWVLPAEVGFWNSALVVVSWIVRQSRGISSLETCKSVMLDMAT